MSAAGVSDLVEARAGGLGVPLKRRPLRRGDEVLLCQTGPERSAGDTYQPRWHFAKLGKPKRRRHWGPVGPRATLWHYKNPETGSFDVTRVWAYVPRCGSGHGYRATALAYGKAPTCKRCLKESS